MKTRIRFTKTGSMKFIGHLDCMRFFQKAIRRAKLDVAYSKGFSPHQLMSFASPLGVGLTSDGEYLDVEFNSLPDMSLPELVTYFNRYMTEELFVTEIAIMPDDFKNSMSLLRSADYMIVEKQPEVFPECWKEKWCHFVEQPEINVVKKTKKSEKTVDLKPHILTWGYECPDGIGEIHCEYEGEPLYLSLTSGSEVNIKPELVLSAFYDFCQETYPPYSCQIHRLQMHFAESRKKK